MDSIVAIVVFNHKGELLAHRRSAGKKLFPGKLALGAGGKVEQSEPVESAAARELEEELGIHDALLHHIGSVDYNGGGVSHAIHLFACTSETASASEEFSELFWITLEDFLEQIRKGAVCPDTALYVQSLLIPWMRTRVRSQSAET